MLEARASARNGAIAGRPVACERLSKARQQKRGRGATRLASYMPHSGAPPGRPEKRRTGSARWGSHGVANNRRMMAVWWDRRSTLHAVRGRDCLSLISHLMAAPDRTCILSGDLAAPARLAPSRRTDRASTTLRTTLEEYACRAQRRMSKSRG